MSHIYIMTNGHRVGIYIYRTAVRSVSIGFLMFGISNVCDSKNNNNICTNNFKHTNQYFFRFDNIVLPYYDTVQLNQICCNCSSRHVKLNQIFIVKVESLPQYLEFLMNALCHLKRHI